MLLHADSIAAAHAMLRNFPANWTKMDAPKGTERYQSKDRSVIASIEPNGRGYVVVAVFDSTWEKIDAPVVITGR